MDVRSIEDKAPVVEHNGTVPVWWMIESREFKDITDGGYLELVNEFEVPGGGLVDPHSHPTHEFYYVMNGRGIMTIDGEDRDDRPGRPRLHPARQGPHPAPGQRPRPHPLLLLRHRREGCRRDRLHHPLRWPGSSSPAACPTAASIRCWTAGHEIVSGRRRRRRSRPTSWSPQAADVDAIVCLLTDRIDAAVLEAGHAGRLRVVANVAVGYDNIDVAAARRSGIAVCNTPGVLDETTADLAFLLILAASRGTSEAEDDLRHGRWTGWGFNTHLAHDVHGAILGLVGYGRIARAVARRAGGLRHGGPPHTAHRHRVPGLRRRPSTTCWRGPTS